jgi:4-oxalocrotonate tautomerase
MPHVIIKLFPGRTREQKEELTRRIVRSVEETVDAEERTISVSFEEVSPNQWEDRVVRPDIAEKKDQVTKFPGYSSKYLKGEGGS